MSRVALVLGAGGVTGHAFHAGVLSALAQATGWEPRDAALVVGTSAGSIVGALLRGGFAARDVAARLTRDPLSPEGRRLAKAMGRSGVPAEIRRPRPFSAMASPRLLMRFGVRPWEARPGALVAAALPAGLIDSDHLVVGINRLMGDTWPARPLWTCAVSLARGTLTVFGRDGAPRVTLGDAVRASCAIPSYYAPVKIDGVRYVDGGVRSPTNADVLAAEDLDLVIVSSPMSFVRGARTLDYPVRALARLALAREVGQLRRRGKTVVTFQPTPDVTAAMGMNTLDVRRAETVVRRARSSALRRLDAPGVRERLASISV